MTFFDFCIVLATPCRQLLGGAAHVVRPAVPGGRGRPGHRPALRTVHARCAIGVLDITYLLDRPTHRGDVPEWTSDVDAR